MNKNLLLIVASAFLVMSTVQARQNSSERKEHNLEVNSVDLDRLGVPKAPTGSKLSKLVAAVIVANRLVAQQSAERAAQLVEELDDVTLVSSTQLGNLLVTGIYAHGTVEVEGLPPYDTGFREQDVPVLIAYEDDVPLWITSGDEATILEQLPLSIDQEGHVICALFVKGSNERVRYSFGDETIVMPESDVDGVGMMVKIDSATGQTLSMEAYPIIIPQPKLMKQ